jgi:hypothetical protein
LRVWCSFAGSTLQREAMSCIADGFGAWVVVVAISVVIFLGC